MGLKMYERTRRRHYNRFMGKRTDSYLPALGFDALTPLYDLLVRLTMPESAFNRVIHALSLSAIRPT